MASKTKAQVFLSRSISTIGLWAAVTAVFLSANPWAFAGLIFSLGAASIREFFSMTSKGKFPTQLIFGPLVSIVYLAAVCVLLALYGGSALDPISQWDGAVISAVVLFSFIFQLLKPVEGQEPMKRVAATVLGFLYVAFLFSFMARILFIDGDATEKIAVPGAWLILWLCVVTKFTDMGAYLTGTICSNFMKTHKMIPHISPGKTWEGFIGAIIIALGSAAGLYAMMPDKLTQLVGWPHVIALGAILPLFAVVGDLAESVIKRSLQIKDSGSFLPGIGGALDLIDSLCFTAPVLYFYLLWLH